MGREPLTQRDPGGAGRGALAFDCEGTIVLDPDVVDTLSFDVRVEQRPAAAATFRGSGTVWKGF